MTLRFQKLQYYLKIFGFLSFFPKTNFYPVVIWLFRASSSVCEALTLCTEAVVWFKSPLLLTGDLSEQDRLCEITTMS